MRDALADHLSDLSELEAGAWSDPLHVEDYEAQLEVALSACEIVQQAWIDGAEAGEWTALECQRLRMAARALHCDLVDDLADRLERLVTA